LATIDMKGFARRGAEARITELKAELDAIYRTFPDLRIQARKVVVNHEEQFAGGVTSRRRRKMSAAQRKAVSERMRKYWAGRRKTAK
jgi:hypothetical protein